MHVAGFSFYNDYNLIKQSNHIVGSMHYASLVITCKFF